MKIPICQYRHNTTETGTTMRLHIYHNTMLVGDLFTSNAGIAFQYEPNYIKGA
jgi:hypothetical protein